MRNSFMARLWAVLLAVCLAATSISTVQMVRVYASEESDDNDGDDDNDNDDDNDDPDPTETPDPTPDPTDTPTPSPDPTDTPTPTPTPTEPAPVPEPDPDPTDYDLTCNTDTVDFGTVTAGTSVDPKLFTVTNIGSTNFPLMFDESDLYTAFHISMEDKDCNLAPGEPISFRIKPDDDLKAGYYPATYVFYSGNDPSRAHTATVNVAFTVVDPKPYVSNVTISPGSISLPVGKSYTFSADVEGGCGYDPSVSWKLEGNNSKDTQIDQNGTLTIGSLESATSLIVVATSKQDPSKSDKASVSISSTDHVINVSADPSEGGAVAGGGSVRNGGSCTLSASANNNYVFKGWYEGNNPVSGSNTVTINNIVSDRNFTARFERQTCYVKLRVNDPDAGSVTDSASVSYGGSMTIKAKPKDGYSFEKWVENDSTLSDERVVDLNNITSDRDITAVFSKDKCKVKIVVNPDGTGECDGDGKYDKDSRVEAVAYATDGYVFANWTINGQVVSNNAKYVIDHIKSDVTLVANFMKKGAQTFAVTSTIANTGGAITPSGTIMVPQGGSVNYNIVPLPGYKISAVMVDGMNIGPVSSYTFNNVNGQHAIAAGFEKVEKSKSSAGSPPAAGNMKVTKYTNETAAEGAMPQQKVVYTAIPDQTDLPDGPDSDYADDVYTVATDTTHVESDPTGGIMAKHNLDEATLRKMIMDDDQVLPLLREAYEDGTLKITVNNTYAADKQETSVALYHDNPTIINFEDVIAETLNEEEKYQVLTGKSISFNIDISDANTTIDPKTKKEMQSLVGIKPFSFFDFVILKTSDGTTSVIDSTNSELEVILPIPEKYRKNGRKFCVIRDHNGDVEVLNDVGNDPAAIIFKTDRFSEYAIAYEATNVNMIILRFAIIAFGSLILTILCIINLLRHSRHTRHAHRHK